MYLNLKDQHLKIYTSIYKLHDDHKPKIYNKYTYMQKEKEFKYNKDGHQITRQESKRRTKEKEVQ